MDSYSLVCLFFVYTSIHRYENVLCASEFCTHSINEILTYKTWIIHHGGEVHKFTCKNWETPRAHKQSPLFTPKSPHSVDSPWSHMDQKCMKYPAVLISNYCHRCLPPIWPRLSQHALLVSVSYNCCLQLLSKRGRDSATQLRGKCHSHAPLVSASPVDEEKCIHCWDIAATDI